MSNAIIIGNTVSLAGAALMVLIGLVKTKKNILIAQCFQCVLLGVGNLILGGVTGFLTNILTIIRNVFSLKYEMTLIWKLVFIVLEIAVGIWANSLGLIGWMPVFAAALFTWFLDLKDNVKFKVMLIACQVLWAIFDIAIRNYVSFSMDILTMGTNLFAINALLKDRGEAGE